MKEGRCNPHFHIFYRVSRGLNPNRGALSCSTIVWPDGNACTHLTTDCEPTQSGHHHAGQHGTVSDLAISDTSRHLQTGMDSTLTARTPHSATSSLAYFLIQLIILMYICI